LTTEVEGIDPLKVAVKITLPQKTPQQVKELRDKLMEKDPEIWVETNDNSFIINITSFRGLMMFDEADCRTITRALIRLLKT